MRVIGGSAGGRRLLPPKGDRVRPTADRVKEAIFSTLFSHFGNLLNMSILDLFAGSGGLGIEALSRGAGFAVFVDNHPQSQQLINKNLHLTGLSDRAQQLTTDVVKALQRLAGEKRAFDIIFIDPPYHEEDLMHIILQMLSSIRLTTDHGLIVFETANKTSLTLPDGLTLLQRRTYGDTAVHYIIQTL